MPGGLVTLNRVVGHSILRVSQSVGPALCGVLEAEALADAQTSRRQRWWMAAGYRST